MLNFQPVTSLDMPELDPYVRLTGAQLRCRLHPSEGILIAESPTVIEVAVTAGCQPLSVLTEQRLINADAARVLTLCDAANPGLPIYTAEHQLLTEITGFPLTRGMLCAMRRPAPRAEGELCRTARRIAVLEGVADATNIGAIFRSAAALGVDAVLLSPTCCDPLCRRAVRVSMGTVFQIPYARLGDTEDEWRRDGIRRLSEWGFRTVAMALSENSIPVDDPRLAAEARLAILLGTEGDGLAPATIAACDYTVRIPMSHGVDSLNVAAASAVAFFAMRPQDAHNENTLRCAGEKPQDSHLCK